MTAAVTAVWERMSVVLPSRAPSVWRSFNKPATEREIEELRRQIHPALLPNWMKAWLGFANGQSGEIGWPAWGMGPLLSAERMLQEHRQMQTVYEGEWPATWLPIMRAGWGVLGVEVDLDVVLDLSLDSPARLVAPSFLSMLTATIDLIEDGTVQTESSIGDYSADLEAAKAYHREVYRALQARLDAIGWAGAPVPPRVELNRPGWPGFTGQLTLLD